MLPTSAVWQSIFALTFVLLISTRLLSASRGHSEIATDGSRSIPMAPYWLPVLGHIPNMALTPAGLFEWARETYVDGIFSLNLGGSTNHFVFKPSLAANLMSKPREVADMGDAIKRLVFLFCGYPRDESEILDNSYEELRGLSKMLLSEPTLGELVKSTGDLVLANVPNLVSFTESVVDQMGWERSSNAEVITTPEGEQVVEASLL